MVALSDKIFESFIKIKGKFFDKKILINFTFNLNETYNLVRYFFTTIVTCVIGR